MADYADTRPSLLLRMRNSEDQRAWEEFVAIYAPLIYGFCYKRGLQEADASDVAQEVMKAVAQAMQKFEYDRERGTFRSWLFTVVRSKLNNHFTKRQKQPMGTGRTTVLDWLNDQEGESEVEKEWAREYHNHVLKTATERIRDEFKESSWQVFWRIAVHDEPPKQVADELGMTMGALYTAKSRIIGRLKQELQAIDEEWPQGFAEAS